MTANDDIAALIPTARRVLDDEIFGRSEPHRGLHGYQEDIVRHLLQHLATNPGMVVAERTGRGKSMIAMATIACLARARSELGGPPLRVGLLAPSEEVLANWVGSKKDPESEPGLLCNALDHETSETYLWREDAIDWRLVCTRFERDSADPEPVLEVFADHYNRGITNGFGTWGDDRNAVLERAREFVWDSPVKQLDLLIIDEAHQLKNASANTGQAIRAIFGDRQPALTVRRMLLLTATPFHLRAAPELARMVKMLRWPRATGVDFPPDLLERTGAQALSDLFERYQRAVCRWLMLRIGKHDADQSYDGATKVREDVERVLRPLIVRTDAPQTHITTTYGRPDPDEASPLPDPSAGLSCDSPVERTLFLAWDGSIASRTTFVASEQQTLTSSASALKARQDAKRKRSATERKHRALAPESVQQALFELSRDLSELLDRDHVKVEATIAAVARRVRTDPLRRPVLVFADRRATLLMLRDRLVEALPEIRTEVVHGKTPRRDRGRILHAFRSTDPEERVHVVLASKVAEMGLDIDGPRDKEDIWLIHHDFPWNPAMVDQRNGRVSRPAKNEPTRPVKITYPFIRDTVDERIFKRMLARQALAELLLGTDDVARALRLTDQASLEGLDLAEITRGALRKLTPDLSPRDTPSYVPQDAGTSTAHDASATRYGGSASEQSTSRPAWCPLELLDLSEARSSLQPPPAFLSRVRAMADELGIECYVDASAAYVRVELDGRRQAVAVLLHDDRVETLSLADTRVDDARVMEAFALNAEPGVAGLMLLTDARAQERIVARAANLATTLDDTELRRLLLETGRRADQWEERYYGADQW